MSQNAFTIDLELQDPVLEESLRILARKRWWAQYLEAQIQNHRLAEYCREGRSLDGLGGVFMQVPTFEYHDAAFQHGGIEVWRDRTWQKLYRRDNPQATPKARGTRIQSGYRRPAPMYVPWARANHTPVRKYPTATPTPKPG